ncbi:hypothetical protein BJX66DRAFT_152870 [Aspergillus keveii]|uniref:Uncharacterized protein n=1 Tax=Aspergillus keveii TaxID=714993 RepID=A0ABR4GA87_9EURO
MTVLLLICSSSRQLLLPPSNLHNLPHSSISSAFRIPSNRLKIQKPGFAAFDALPAASWPRCRYLSITRVSLDTETSDLKLPLPNL